MNKINIVFLVINVALAVYLFQLITDQQSAEPEVIEVEKVVEKIIEKPVYIEKEAVIKKPVPAASKAGTASNHSALNDPAAADPTSLTRPRTRQNNERKRIGIFTQELYDAKSPYEQQLNQGQTWDMEWLEAEQQVWVDSINDAIHHQAFYGNKVVDELICANDICRMTIKAGEEQAIVQDENFNESFEQGGDSSFTEWHSDIVSAAYFSKNGEKYRVFYMAKNKND